MAVSQETILTAQETGICGDCGIYDKKATDGTLVFDAKSELPAGYCRAEKGLLLGKRTADLRCARPIDFISLGSS